MPNLAQGHVQLALHVRQRARLRPRCRSPPRDSGGEALFPSIEPVGLETQFLGHDLGGLAALEPVLDRFPFECFIELTTDFDRCLLHLLFHCFTRFTVRQFGATSENLTETPTSYGCSTNPLGYTLNEVIDTDTSTNGLNPLPNGSITVNWFGPTANYAPFAGYGGALPYYYGPGGASGALSINTQPISGQQQVYASFLRDGVNYGPGSSSGNNDQPGYSIDITGLKSLFTNTPFVVELIASADSMNELTNAFVTDVANAITNSVSYPNTPPVQNQNNTLWPRGIGGGLSTVSGAFTNADHIHIMSAQPAHDTVSGTYNNAGTISGFIITDKPVVSMSPQSVPLAEPGDAVTLSAYAIGVAPLSYQWRLNGRVIPGATTLTNTIASLSAATAGNYDLVVANAYGSTTSQVATVGEVLSQGSAVNVVYDSNPDNAQHDGVNMGATWAASNSDGTITRTGVMSFVAESSNGISLPDSSSFDGTNGTITFWMQSAGTDESANGNNGAALFGRTTGSSPTEFLLYQVDGSGNLSFEPPNGANGLNSVKGVSDSKWHFVALTFGQAATDVSTFYIDGAFDSSITNGAAWTWPSGTPIEIGYTTDTAWRDYPLARSCI
jgi:hypothetical protein